jgi:hypothetical protein
MNDTFSSLSARSIALRVLPAVIVLLMLLVGPPKTPSSSQPQRSAHGDTSLEATGATKSLP